MIFKGVKEFRRVLKPRAWLILLVPIYSHLLKIGSTTDFGQSDHKRLYSNNFLHLVESKGFTCVPIIELINTENYRIHRHHFVHKYADIFCNKTRNIIF